MTRALVGLGYLIFIYTFLALRQQPNKFLVSFPGKVQFGVWIEIFAKKKFSNLSNFFLFSFISYLNIVYFIFFILYFSSRF